MLSCLLVCGCMLCMVRFVVVGGVRCVVRMAARLCVWLVGWVVCVVCSVVVLRLVSRVCGSWV